MHRVNMNTLYREVHPPSLNKQIRSSWGRGRGSRSLPQYVPRLTVPSTITHVAVFNRGFSLCTTTQLFLCLLWLHLIIPESPRNVNSHGRRSEEGGWGRGLCREKDRGWGGERESKRIESASERSFPMSKQNPSFSPLLCYFDGWEEYAFYTVAIQIELGATFHNLCSSFRSFWKSIRVATVKNFSSRESF